MNLSSDALCCFSALSTMNQLRKVGTQFLEREDNNTCRKTYSLGSYHNILWVKELLQRKVLENTELLIKNKNSLVVFISVPPTPLMSYLIF